LLLPLPRSLLHLGLLPRKLLLHEHACTCTYLAFTESHGDHHVACGFATLLHIGIGYWAIVAAESISCLTAVAAVNLATAPC